MLCPIMKKLVLILGLFAWFSVAGAAPQPNAAKLRHLPPAVRQAVRQHLGDGKVERVAKTTDDDGQLNYEVTIAWDGKTRDFTFATDGKLLEREVFFEETPPEVQKTIHATAKGITPDNITQTTDERGATNYDVEITETGVTRDFTVRSDGALDSIQVFLAEVPPVIQKAIRETLDNAALGSITKSMEDGEISYDVEVTKDGQKREFSVGANGHLQSREVSLAETPAAVQKTIQAELKESRIDEIDHETDDGESVFVVRMTQDGKTRAVNISPAGQIVPADP